MKRTVEKLENCKTNVTVVFEENEWKEAREKAYKKLASNVEIKGFRKGKAPENLVRAKINDAEVMQHAIDILLPDAYSKVLEEEKLEPFAQPKVSVTKLSDTECEAVITVITRPEVELGDYKGLTIGHNAVVVDDEALNTEITKRLQDNAELVLKEGAAEKGNTVVIDFEGFVDDVAFEGGKADNYSLELGSNTFIPGFEDQLVGATAEQDVDVKVTFPEEYGAANLAGKPAVFKVKVHEIKEKKIPTLDDDFVADLDIKDVKTVDEYRTFVKNDLTKGLEKQEQDRYYNALLEKITENAKVSIPDEIVDNEVEAMFDNLKNQVEQNGLNMEQYFQLVKRDEESVRKEMHDVAVRNISTYFVIEKVAEVEEITVTDETIDFEVQKLASLYNMEPEKVKEIVLKDRARFAESFKHSQVSQFLVKNND